MRYKKLNVNTKADNALDGFVKAYPKWRYLTYEEYIDKKMFEIRGAFASQNFSDYLVAPNGKIWKFHSFFHCNNFIYSVTLKSR